MILVFMEIVQDKLAGTPAVSIDSWHFGGCNLGAFVFTKVCLGIFWPGLVRYL